MGQQIAKILLIEDNPGDARLIQEMFAEAEFENFQIDWAANLSQGLERLSQGGIDLMLLDLGLPDSQGLETFIQAYSHAPALPFVLLTGLDDETLAVTAVRKGAQDYLVKGKTDASMLFRAIRHATERKQLEIAIDTERQKLFNVLNNLPAFVYLRGEDFKIVFANRRFQEIFGKPGDRTCYEVLRGKSRPCEDCQSLDVAKTQAPQMFEWTTADQACTYEVYSYPFRENHNSLTLTLGLDITKRKHAEQERRESEDRFRAIFEQAAVGVGLADIETGQFLKVNEKYGEILGLTPEEMQATTFKAITHPDDLPAALENVRKMRQGLIRDFSREKRYLRKDGSIVWVNLTVSAMWKLGEPPDYNIAVVEDISERKRAEEKLRVSEVNLRYLATKLMNAQERERERISRDLHDELGQSLLLLKLQIRQIERQLHQKQADTRKECLDALANFDRLIENVRRLSRDLSPTILVDLGLSTALQRLIKEFSQLHIIQTKIELLPELDGLFPPEAQLNIYRIIQESLTNIGKYARASNILITITRNSDQISFLIDDNGLGFEVEKVLASESTSRGLGLAAMEERVRMMGGTLKIKSQQGRGTKILFAVPIPNPESK